MKSLLKICMVTALVVLGSTAVKAQQSASATAAASATIIEPILINKTQDLNFGSVGVSTSTGGTVVVAPAGTRSATGGVFLPTSGVGVTAATFTVTGEAGLTYAITLPGSSVDIKNANNTIMSVSGFTSNPPTTGTLVGGSQTLQVGATLNVAAAQEEGTYTTATPFQVTVNYN